MGKRGGPPLCIGLAQALLWHENAYWACVGHVLMFSVWVLLAGSGTISEGVDKGASFCHLVGALTVPVLLV